MSVSDLDPSSGPSVSDLDPLDRPIFGAAEIGKVLGISERAARWHLDKKHLDASDFGGRWCSTPRRILNSVLKTEGQSTAKADNAAA